MKTIDGFDDCIVGVVERFGLDPIVCYDRKKIVSKLMIKEGMSFEQAFEHFDYNIFGSWVGEDTPCFLTIDKKLETFIP